MASHGWSMGAVLSVFIVFLVQEGVSKDGGIQYHTITVDQSGHGNFRTIQSAIDSVPSNNDRWVCIHVKAGVYRSEWSLDF